MPSKTDLEGILKVTETCIKHGLYEEAENLAYAVETYTRDRPFDELAEKAALLRGKAYLSEGSQWLDEGQPERAMRMYLTVLSYAEEKHLPEIIKMSSEMVDKNKGCTPEEKAMLLLKAGKVHESEASYFCFIEKYSTAYEKLMSAIKKYDAALQTGSLPFHLQREAAEQIFLIENQLEMILAEHSPVISCKDAKLYLN